MSTLCEHPAPTDYFSQAFRGPNGEELTDVQVQELAEVVNGDVESHQDSVWFTPEIDGWGAKLRGKPLVVGGVVVRWAEEYEGAIIRTPQSF